MLAAVADARASRRACAGVKRITRHPSHAAWTQIVRSLPLTRRLSRDCGALQGPSAAVHDGCADVPSRAGEDDTTKCWSVRGLELLFQGLRTCSAARTTCSEPCRTPHTTERSDCRCCQWKGRRCARTSLHGWQQRRMNAGALEGEEGGSGALEALEAAVVAMTAAAAAAELHLTMTACSRPLLPAHRQNS